MNFCCFYANHTCSVFSRGWQGDKEEMALMSDSIIKPTFVQKSYWLVFYSCATTREETSFCILRRWYLYVTRGSWSLRWGHTAQLWNKGKAEELRPWQGLGLGWRNGSQPPTPHHTLELSVPESEGTETPWPGSVSWCPVTSHHD